MSSSRKIMSYDRALKSMGFDWRVCSRARLARDARFDGKFFIGVVTTRIYCRPICRSRTSKESNVRYFPSAAAAAEAGFRPCLRCRPESSPGTPLWLGTQNTVARALRLIQESGLEEGVDALADRLGVGSRHLRRLFLKHLGTTPLAVAHTRRLHFAKKLIDETALPMCQLAIAAGYGCVRRFNAAFRGTYQRTPTQIRRLARHSPELPKHQYLFRLHFRPPYNWEALLGFMAARATPGVEAVEDGIYRRSISHQSRHGFFEVSRSAEENSLAVRIQFADPAALFSIVERIRAMFDLSADWTQIARILRNDPLLAERLRASPGLRVPGCWDAFELSVRAILGQQITVRAATTLAGRIVQMFGKPLPQGGGLTHLFPTPAILADADLARAGVIRARAAAICALARAVCDRQIQFERIADSGDFLSRLSEMPGIGSWTAQYIAMRALGEPDAFPTGDVALLRALNLSSHRELERRSQLWRPWRAYAAMYLWNVPAVTSDSSRKSLARAAPPPPQSQESARSRAGISA
jgi:AraC family transcriptional regulator, regulatory protein of adaptative response / DNA-3-methyladenine glycosylase II